MRIIIISSVLVTTGSFLIAIIKGLDLPMTKSFPATLVTKGIKGQRMADKQQCFYCPDF